MFISKVKLIASVLLLVLSQCVTAECNAKFGEVRHIYDDFENYYPSQPHPARKELRVNLVNNSDCNTYMLLTTYNNSKLKGVFQSINYLIKNNNQVLILPAMTRIAFIDSVADINLYIPAGSVVRAGEYNDNLILKLFDEDDNLLDEKNVEIQEDILDRASISILGYNTNSSNVYLGELIPGKDFNMLPSFKIVTNTDVILNVYSENGGELRHNVYKTKYTIGYLLNLGGEWADLQRNYSRLFSYNGRDSFFLNLKIKLESFKNQAAGEYTDVIRFQISPLNY